MSGIRLNGRAYGGVATVTDADHLMCEDGSGNVISAQTMIQNILGDMASIEQSDTASKAYAVGDYLVLNSHLYRVIVAIAADGTITPGTNVVVTNVGKEINHKVLWWTGQNISNTNGAESTLIEINDLAITGDHILDKFVAENPSVITSAVTCTTTAGQATLTGVSTGTTTAEIKLVKKDN